MRATLATEHVITHKCSDSLQSLNGKWPPAQLLKLSQLLARTVDQGAQEQTCPLVCLQIIPPHDVGIAAAIEAQTELWSLAADALCNPLVTDPLHMVTQRYYYALQQDLSFRPRQDNPKAAPVVYTPLHGVGLPWVQKVPGLVCLITWSHEHCWWQLHVIALVLWLFTCIT